LQMFNGIADGFWSTTTAIFGIVLFFVGLSKLKTGIDNAGQSAVKTLIIAAIISCTGLVFNIIPFIGEIIASIVLLVAFVFQLVGYIKLKQSDSIGTVGKEGATLLIVAMILSAFGSLINIIPLIGGYVVSIFSLVGLILVLFGWTKVQEGLID
nr:hypothetical protein [Bacteroidales bacterium]